MKRTLFSVLSAAVLLLASSCGKDYLNVNTDPNNPTSATPDLVLPTALLTTASRLSHQEIGAFWSGQWSPTGSVSGFQTERTYTVAADFRNNIWNGIYDNLNDYQYIEDQATALKQPAFVGIAKTMKVLNYQILVDTYGNVPYSEAMKGTGVIRPKYDDAKAIYEDLAVQLDAATTELSKPITAENPSPASSDIIFKGNMTRWVKFANTLKLRLLMRQTNVAGRDAYIKAEIAKIKGGFLGAGEDALADPGFIKSTGKMNPFYENYGFTAADTKSGNKDFYTYSSFFVNTLTSFRDPRLDRLAYLPEDAAFRSAYRGVPFGDGNDAYTAPKVSAFGPAFLPQLSGASASDLWKRPQPVMLAAESFFLQAEAAQRGYLTGDAKTLYQSGITESFRYLGVPSAATAAAEYYNQAVPNVGWEASTDKIEAIVTQKWIANANVNGFEAWSDFRRTGFPRVPLSTRAQGTQHPMRLLYPNSELGTNADNVRAQGDITAFTKLFWEK